MTANIVLHKSYRGPDRRGLARLTDDQHRELLVNLGAVRPGLYEPFHRPIQSDEKRITN